MDQELKRRFDEIKKLTLLAAKNVFDVNDLAFYLGRSPKTIRNQINEIPHYKNGKTVYFKRDEIEAWQCQVQHKTTDQLMQR